MKRFKFWQKLTLLGFLFATPLAAVLLWVIATKLAPRELGRAPQEIAAVEIQTHLLRLLHELQIHRDLAHGVANTNAAFTEPFAAQPAKVQRAAKQAAEAISRLADTLDVQVEWKALASHIDEQLKGRAYAYASQAFVDRSKLLTEVRALIETAGNRSPLSEESDGERYRLMSALQYKGSELLDALANARAIAIGISSRTVLARSDTQRGEFDLLREEAARIEAALKSTEGTFFHSIERVMKSRPETKPALATLHTSARRDTEECLRLIR